MFLYEKPGALAEGAPRAYLPNGFSGAEIDNSLSEGGGEGFNRIGRFGEAGANAGRGDAGADTSYEIYMI